jgi:hypothetical protein
MSTKKVTQPVKIAKAATAPAPVKREAFKANSTVRYDIHHGDEVIGIVKEHADGAWSFESWKPLPRPSDGKMKVARFTQMPNEEECIAAALRFFTRRLEGVGMEDLALAPHDPDLRRDRAPRDDSRIMESIQHAQALLAMLKAPPKKGTARKQA